jgi:hypothetical protein
MPVVFPAQAELVAETTPYVHGVLGTHGSDGSAGLDCAGMGG